MKIRVGDTVGDEFMPFAMGTVLTVFDYSIRGTQDFYCEPVALVHWWELRAMTNDISIRAFDITQTAVKYLI